MKVTEYDILNEQTRSELVRVVNAKISGGWEILGAAQALPGGVWWQTIVKRFDPHEGKVWLKLEGKRGQWVDPETAALARQSS